MLLSRRAASFFLQMATTCLCLTAPTYSYGQAENAEAFYIANVESIIQAQCIICHRSGGVAQNSGLLYTASASSNHQVLLNYVNTPSLGARGDFLLSNASGGSGHGGGTVLPVGSTNYNTLASYVDLLSTPPPPPQPDKVFRVSLEEPIDGEVHGGVGNLRGWAVATDGIDKVEILIDGAFAFNAPYGGARGDVAGAFPDVQDSLNSGFSTAYAYSLLSTGEHTVTIIAYDQFGETIEQTNTFTVAKFDNDFIVDPNAVNLDGASCMVSGNEVSIMDGTVDGKLYDFIMKWRTAEQGFEIIEVR